MQSNTFRRLGWLLMFVWLAHPADGFAQDMSFDLNEAGGASKSKGHRKQGKKGKKRPGKSGDAVEAADTQPAAPDASETPAPIGGDTGVGEGAAGGNDAGGDVIGDLAKDQKKSGAYEASPLVLSKETREEIYAVQQVYALRHNRLEIAPSMSFTLNDPFMSHPAPAIAINYWWTNVLAIGANFLWYQGLESESDLGFSVRRFSRLAIPINEYQLAAYLNFTYVPIYGKFSMFNNNIFQWDMYVVGGVGTIRTRPVPVIDPEVRQFNYDWRVAFNVGIGARVFITRWLAVSAELRDYMFLENFENTNVALGNARYDKSTWLADSQTFTNNFTVHLGLNVFIPFSFDYKLPK